MDQKAPDEYKCAITLEIMHDPVICSDGHTYERQAIERWFAQAKHTSPKTGARLQNQEMHPNHALRNAIERWRETFFREIKPSQVVVKWSSQIGRGSFGRIFAGELNQRQIAVKAMSPGQCEEEAAKLIKMGRHPGLLRYLGICNLEQHVTLADGYVVGQLLITELAPFGSLDNLLEVHSVSMAHKLSIIRQIASAMESLTMSDIVHCDLAIRNVLVFAFDESKPADVQVKIGDFGLSISRYYQTHAYRQGDIVPMRWMAPETIKKRKWSEKSDVWAFGVTVWELLTDGEIPYCFIGSNEEVGKRVCDGSVRLEMPDACPVELWTIVVKCWAARPEDRPTFRALVAALEGLWHAQLAIDKTLKFDGEEDGASFDQEATKRIASADRALEARKEAEANERLAAAERAMAAREKDEKKAKAHAIWAIYSGGGHGSDQVGGPSCLSGDASAWLEGQVRERISDKRNAQRLVDVQLNTVEHATLRRSLKSFFGQERVLCLQSLQRIENPFVASRFNSFRPPVAGSSNFRFLVHGTSLKQAKEIAKGGFRLPSERDEKGWYTSGSNSRKVEYDNDDEEWVGMLRFGGGLYFTSEARKAELFAATSESPALVICAVKLGRSMIVDEDHSDHYSLDAARIRRLGFDSVYHDDPHTGEKNEYVVYDTGAVLPLYIASYHSVRPRRIDFFLEQQLEPTTFRSSSSYLTAEVQSAYEQIKTSFGQYADKSAAPTDSIYALLRIIGDGAQQGVDAQCVDFLRTEELKVIIKGLSVSCEGTQWQALRALSNFCFESKRRQAMLHEPRILQILLPRLYALLNSDNEAVVQKAAFLACNLTSHHAPPEGMEGRRLIQALVGAVKSTSETMTTFYAAAAIANAIVDQETAAIARPVVEEVMSELKTAASLPLWITWTVNMIRNFIQVGDQSASIELVDEHMLGERLASIIAPDSVSDSDSPCRVRDSEEAREAIANCLAWTFCTRAPKTSAIVKQFCAEDGDSSLAGLLAERSTRFCCAQAIAFLFNAPGFQLKPSLIDPIARQYRASESDAGNRAQLARALLTLTDKQLRSAGLERTKLETARDAAPKQEGMGLSRLSLKDD